MSDDMGVAFIGVFGTLAGAIVGWLLNNFSRRGKISVYVAQWSNNFRIDTIMLRKPKLLIDGWEKYYYNLSLDVYNSSSDTKIMRDIKIIFMHNKKTLLESIPGNGSMPKSVGPLTIYEKIAPVNIPPKSVLTLKLHGDIFGDIQRTESFWGTDKVMLLYKDENNKEKTILLMKENFKKYVDNNTVEVTENG